MACPQKLPQPHYKGLAGARSGHAKNGSAYTKPQRLLPGTTPVAPVKLRTFALRRGRRPVVIIYEALTRASVATRLSCIVIIGSRPARRRLRRRASARENLLERLKRLRLDALPVFLLHPRRILSRKVLIDVVEPLRPGKAPRFPEIDDFCAEAAPKASLEVASVASLVTSGVHCSLVVNTVVFIQVMFEGIPPVIGYSTRTSILQLLGALPELELDMLTVLMALPVILTAKVPVAILMSTGVGLLMALHVFPVSCQHTHPKIWQHGSVDVLKFARPLEPLRAFLTHLAPVLAAGRRWF